LGRETYFGGNNDFLGKAAESREVVKGQELCLQVAFQADLCGRSCFSEKGMGIKGCLELATTWEVGLNDNGFTQAEQQKHDADAARQFGNMQRQRRLLQR